MSAATVCAESAAIVCAESAANGLAAESEKS